MADLILRTLTNAGDVTLGVPLSNVQVDTNFINLDADIATRATSNSPTFTGTVILPDTTSIGTVSNLEISYLDGVTSGIQGQINTKSPLASPTFTGTVVLPVTTSIGTVSDIEIGYLDGVTSNIQTQINGLGSSSGSTNIVTVGTIGTGTWQGTDIEVSYGGTGASTFVANSVLLGNGINSFQTVAPGASGNVLSSNGTTWVSSTASASGATITDDVATNTTQYIGMSRITTGAWTTAYTASTLLTFNPSTGTLSSTVFNSTSDARMKDNIRSLGYGLSDVLKLTGKKFEMCDTGITSIGLIAQEVAAVIPEVVLETDSNTGMLGINYPVLVSVLIESIKELEARVRMLEGK